MAQYSVAGLSLLVLCLLIIAGRAPERFASIALLIAMFGTPAVDGFDVGGVRVGVAALALALFGCLSLLAMLWDRWWLLSAAGVQLLSVGSWATAFAIPDTQIWAGVSFRMVVWLELMCLGAFGIWEARRAPYASHRLIRR